MKPSPKNTSTLSDGELLERYRTDGNLELLGELYTRYGRLIYGLCLKYLGTIESAEDAVMQLFEEIIPKVRQTEIREFRTWIYSVAKNHCLQQLRKKRPEFSFDSGEQSVELEDIVHLLEKEENEKRLIRLEECMKKLPEPQRESIRLFFMEEKSYADITDATAYSLKSVKSYIQNGKRNLKICMESQEA